MDPRYPSTFQRGGAPEGAPAPRRLEPPARHVDPAPEPVLDEGVAVAGATHHRGVQRVVEDRAHFEIIVAGNPWLRALWLVGGVALALALGLIVYGEFAFSIAPADGIYDPSAYVLPRIAQVLALPLSIAGVVALTAAATLRIVAWRPSGARLVED
jgi:hypothetical protein